MTDLLNDVDTPSDAELIARVRGGDVSAYGVLFSRHKDAANRLARQLVRGPDADDLVSEAFAKVLTVLQGGGGPDVAFRAYLLTAVRRLHVDRIRSGQRLQTTDDMAQFDPGVPFQDTAVAGFENGAAAKAFASLPERWQLVLWHLEVEGNKPADIAALLGMSPNSVSALAYRAREGLRQAFLTMHLSDISETECRWINEHLGAFVRKGLAKRDATKVQSHLDGCRRCTAMHLELTEVNGNLAGIIAPLLLGAAATGYLAAVAGGGGVGAAGVLTLLGRARDIAAVHTGAVTAGTVASGAVAAAVATVVVTHVGGKAPDVVADPPVGLASRPPATAGVTPGPSTGPTPSVSPSASPTGSPTTTASATPSVSPSMVPSFTPSPTVSLSPMLPLEPTASATPTPTDAPSDTPTGDPTATDEPTDVPTDPTQPNDDTPTADDPVVAPDGTVTVTVHRATPTDVVGVQVVSGSGDTTFVTSGLPDSCTSVAADTVSCTPVPAAAPQARLAAVAARAGAEWTVVLPLAYPDDMVDDDVHVVVSINGGAGASSASQTFHPDRTPRFDFRVGDVVQTSHSLVGGGGDVDAYTVRTTAHLPRRLAGLRYTLSGDSARFGAAGDGCEVGGDGTTYTCPDVRDGADVDLPLTATGLTAAAEATVTVTPLVGFDDPDATDDTTIVRLRPGADLGLDLSVSSANPDRNNLVELTGSLTGAGRTGLTQVRYEVSGSATFPATRNDGCTVTPDGGSMDCPADPDVDLTVRTGDRSQQATVSIGVLPVAPFEKVGSSTATSVVTLPDRPVHDLSLVDLVRTSHTVSGNTDRYTLSGTVRGIADGFRTVYFSLPGPDGSTFAADQSDPHCTLDSTPGNGGSVRCDGLADGGGVSLVVDSTTTRTHDVAVTVSPADPFDDPTAADNSATVTGLRPGTHLTLAPHDLGRLHQDAAGGYAVRTTVSGVRDGVDAVSIGLSPGVTVGDVRTAGCRPDGASVLCEGLIDGSPVAFTVTSAHPARATDLTLTVTPDGDFVDVGDDRPDDNTDDNTATAALAPAYDFSLGDLTLRGRAVSGGADVYTLRTSVPALPGDLDTVDLEVTEGGTIADDQPGACRRTDSTHVRCAGLAAGGTLDLTVSSTAATRHPVSVRLVRPAGYDDPDPTNETATLGGLSPAVDLHLANLDADNDSPANDDDRHLVSSRLSGVRPGLASVTYTLTGDATFVGSDRAGCAADGRTLTCTNPVDGDLTFTVEATDRRAVARIGITVSPDAPFVEVAEADNADSVRLLPRPTYDFAMGALDVDGHTVSGGTDHYLLGSQVSALPNGLGTVGFAVTGGTFADGQASGCSTVDATHVTCGDLADARRVTFRVDSTATARHQVAIALVLPRRYVDPDPGDDQRSLDVAPAVDLHLGMLVPSAPLPQDDGSFVVTTALGGVRGGPVAFTVSGATVTASSCDVSDVHTVTCASPTEGQRVTFTLLSGQPRGVEAVTIRASSPSYAELDPGDNAATTSLAPDVAIASLSVTGHRGVRNSIAVVRADLTGIPTGVTRLRMQLSGAGVGPGPDQVHLTNGAAGSDGQGGVDCYVSDAAGRPLDDGTYATCTGVGSALTGGFWVDVRVRHPHGTPTPVTVTVLPLGVDEGSHGTANNSRDLTVD